MRSSDHRPTICSEQRSDIVWAPPNWYVDPKTLPVQVNKINLVKLMAKLQSVVGVDTRMDFYIKYSTDPEAVPSPEPNFTGSVHKWRVFHRESGPFSSVNTWEEPLSAVLARFQVFERQKITSDKFPNWKQLIAVTSFDGDFQKIILEIPGISVAEKVDRYYRRLKRFTWKQLWARVYNDLSEIPT